MKSALPGVAYSEEHPEHRLPDVFLPADDKRNGMCLLLIHGTADKLIFATTGNTRGVARPAPSDRGYYRIGIELSP